MHPANELSGMLLVGALTLAVSLAVCCWRLRILSRALRAMAGELVNLQGDKKGSQTRLQQLQEELTQKRQELQSLKADVGAQRKKNHSVRAEMSELRESLRLQTKLRLAAETARPAFSVPEERHVEPFVPTPPPTPRPAPPSVDTELQTKLKKSDQDIGELRDNLLAERANCAALKDELRLLRRRSEGLRRIDIISKSKMELLADKLRTMGRQYYDAISELAVLKNEVAPPPPPRIADVEAAEPAHEEALM